jgi:hypothetical protein
MTLSERVYGTRSDLKSWLQHTSHSDSHAYYSALASLYAAHRVEAVCDYLLL